jgi:hypothetical protein
VKLTTENGTVLFCTKLRAFQPRKSLFFLFRSPN